MYGRANFDLLRKMTLLSICPGAGFRHLQVNHTIRAIGWDGLWRACPRPAYITRPRGACIKHPPTPRGQDRDTASFQIWPRKPEAAVQSSRVGRPHGSRRPPTPSGRGAGQRPPAACLGCSRTAHRRAAPPPGSRETPGRPGKRLSPLSALRGQPLVAHGPRTPDKPRRGGRLSDEEFPVEPVIGDEALDKIGGACYAVSGLHRLGHGPGRLSGWRRACRPCGPDQASSV